MHKTFLILLLGTALVLPGCSTYERHGLDSARAGRIEDNFGLKAYTLSPEIEDTILGLDPEHVTEKDIREALSKAPAPQIINIHGGIMPQKERLISFSHFLIGMGYPEASIRNPGDATLSFSCYENAEMIAGMIAWYYEKEGLRPMIVGNSQGGMEDIRILDMYAYSERVEVWSPLTWKGERRYEITDPLTGRKRPVAGLTLPYVTSTGAGGLTRLLPNQWDMNFRLRTVPDTVEEFTGFHKGRDLLGGDFLGYGPANLFKASGTAHVRNVRLPAGWKHGPVPDTEHLLKSQAIMDRINRYHPPPEANIVIEQNEDTMNPETMYLPWAEDVWFSIKKHWVLELQRLILARRAMRHGP
ncbi:MAG: hypothetical protein ABSF52_07030 [Syntrophobacteraceae bacterium]|jgi:hypothetical protein